MKSIPCVGCGEVTESYGRPLWTKKDPLCPECKRKIKEYDSLVNTLGKTKTELAHVPTSNDIWNWTRGAGGGKSPWYYVGRDTEKLLSEPILALFKCFPEVGEYGANEAKGAEVKAIFHRGYENTVRAFPPGFIKAFHNLLNGFGEYTKECAKDGERRGSDLLGRLMDGEVTNEEINERMKENKG